MGTAGIVMPFAGSTAPQGWMLCNGAAVSRTTYAALFAVIGTTYGEGDGETTFNIPDLSGRVVIGVSNTHAIGSTGGEEFVTLDSDQMPAHSHEVPQHGHENDIGATMPELTHSITQPVYKYNRPNVSKSNSGSHAAITSSSTQTATRSTNVAVSDHASAACTVAGSVTPCTPLDSGTFGGNGSHNNMQPYTAMNYIIFTGE